MPNNDSQQKKQIRIELERLATERLALEEARRLRVAEERRAANLESLIGRYANLSENVSGLIKLVRELLATNEAERVFREDLADQIEEIKSILILILAKLRDGRQLEQVRQVLDADRRKSLKRQLAKYSQHLNALEEKIATYGDLAVPAYLKTEVATTRDKIEKIEGMLDGE